MGLGTSRRPNYPGWPVTRTRGPCAPETPPPISCNFDVWGETLDGLALARNAGIAGRDDAWDLQVALMNHLEGAWDQPDNGLWEMRGARRHFTHSKVLAWVGANRMAAAVRTHPELHGPADRWEALADTIHADVLAHGFDAERNTFTQSYDAPGLDAGPADDPSRGVPAPEGPARTGHHHPRSKTGSPRTDWSSAMTPPIPTTGSPGARGCSWPARSGWWTLCTWPDARPRPRRLFERLLTLRNDVGLLSEEWDPKAGRQLGNTPQAFSHFPLVTSALQLHSGHGHHSSQPIAAP